MLTTTTDPHNRWTKNRGQVTATETSVQEYLHGNPTVNVFADPCLVQPTPPECLLQLHDFNDWAYIESSLVQPYSVEWDGYITP